MPRPSRFGFYKYMKMDKEEGEEDEQVQHRAFLFLNPDGEWPLHCPPVGAHLGMAGLTVGASRRLPG